MSREGTSKQELISIFGNKAKGCNTDDQKIKFFDSNKEAFFTNSNETTLWFNEIPKDLDDAFYVYANMKKHNEMGLEKLKSLTQENLVSDLEDPLGLGINKESNQKISLN